MFFICFWSYSTCERYYVQSLLLLFEFLDRQPHVVCCGCRGTSRRVCSEYSNVNSMACPKKRFTYRAIVCELTALCRYSYDKIPSGFSLKRSICYLYSLRQLIMQNFSLGSNDWKTKRGWCLPGLVDFLVALM